MCMIMGTFMYSCALSPSYVPPVPSVLDSVCTEYGSHDSLHPAMLQGMTEMLYTVSGSSEVTLNDAGPFSVELYTITSIDPLYEITSTEHHSGNHFIGDFCIEAANDAALIVV